MLAELYLWMISPLNASLPQLGLITKEFLKEEEDALEKQDASFVREAITGKSLSNSPEHLLDKTLSPVFNQHDFGSFFEFLQSFKNALNESAQISIENLFGLALNYLAITPHIKSHLKSTKGQSLFASFLAVDAKKALHWYEINKELSKTFSVGIGFLVAAYLEEQSTSITEIAERKEEIHLLLAFEKEVLGILPLFLKAVDEELQFAALLLTALERGVSTEQLVASGILNAFIAYHFPQAGQENNAISQLGKALKQFPGTEELVGKLNSAFTQYSHSPGSCTCTITAIFFTKHEENLTNLISLFAERFLKELCWQVALSDEGELKKWLVNYLENHINYTDLTSFINSIGNNNDTVLLQLLSQLLSPATVKQLKGQGELFYLAPYRPDILSENSNIASLRDHLHSLKNSQRSVYDIVTLLTLLLKNIKKKNQNLKELVFAEALDLLLQNHFLAYDDALMLLLEKEAARQPHVLKVKAATTLKEWHHALSELLPKNDYPAMVNLWAEYSKFFSICQQLGQETLTFPANIYSLYASLVKSLAIQADFKLENFLNVLLPPELTEGIGTRERVLIEILAAVDNKAIFQATISLLEKTSRQNGLWSIYPYEGDSSVLSLAASYGNLECVQFLLSPATAGIPKPTESAISEALAIAAELGHLPIVQIICELNVLNKQCIAITEALNRAALGGKLLVVQFLCDLDNNKANSSAIRAALMQAVWGEKLAIVQSLISLLGSSERNKIAIAKALRFAAQLGREDIVQFLCTLDSDNKPHPLAVGLALHAAAHAGNLASVVFLCSLPEKNKPSPTAIEDALQIAARAGRRKVVKFLCRCQLNPTTINKAIELAVKRGKLKVVLLLCKLKSNTEKNLADVAMALKTAALAGQLPIVESLCNLPGKISPSAVAQAIIAAAKKGHLAIVEFLCKLTLHNESTPEMLAAALKVAAKKGEFPVVKFLCKNNLNNKKAIAEALNQALWEKRWIIVKFLCGLQTDNRPDSEINGEALRVGAMEGEMDLLQLLCKLSPENRPDERAFEDAFYIATEAGKLSAVKLLCNFCNRQTVQGALNLAVAEGQLAIVKFFSSLKTSNRPSKGSLSKALKLAVNLKRVAIMEFLPRVIAGKEVTGSEMEVAFFLSKIPKIPNTGPDFFATTARAANEIDLDSSELPHKSALARRLG